MASHKRKVAIFAVIFNLQKNFWSQLLAPRCRNYLALDISHCKCFGSFRICLKILYSINGQGFEPSLLEHTWLINRMDFLAIISPLCIIINDVLGTTDYLNNSSKTSIPGTEDNKNTLAPCIIFSKLLVQNSTIRTRVFSTCAFFSKKGEQGETENTVKPNNTLPLGRARAEPCRGVNGTGTQPGFACRGLQQ